MATWNRQTWIQRGNDPDDPRAWPYNIAVTKLACANPPTLEDDAADEACMAASEDATGEDILRDALRREMEEVL